MAFNMVAATFSMVYSSTTRKIQSIIKNTLLTRSLKVVGRNHNTRNINAMVLFLLRVGDIATTTVGTDKDNGIMIVLGDLTEFLANAIHFFTKLDTFIILQFRSLLAGTREDGGDGMVITRLQRILCEVNS